MINDLAKGLLAASIEETRKNTGSEGEGAVEILLREAIVSQVQLARGHSSEIGLVDSKRIEAGNVVATGLVGTDKKLDLQVVNDIRRSDLGARNKAGNTSAGGDGGSSLEGLGGGHAVGLVSEVNLPREMDRGGVSEPSIIHLLDVAGRVALEEGVLGGRDVVLGASGGLADGHEGGNRSGGAGQVGAHQQGRLACNRVGGTGQRSEWERHDGNM